MIFNQLFDDKSSTYTYIIASGKGREALIIDPVIEHTEEYIKLLKNLKLKLVKVIKNVFSTLCSTIAIVFSPSATTRAASSGFKSNVSLPKENTSEGS